MKNRIRKSPFAIIILTLLIVYVLLILLPFIWSLITSLKTRIDFNDNVFGLPKKWMLSNYPDAFKNFVVEVPWGTGSRNIGLLEMFCYSVIYAGGAAFLNAFVIFLTAYLTARYKYKFSSILYMVVIVVMILPIVGSLPSQMQIVKKLGLYDNIFGILLMHAGFTGIYFLVVHAQFKSISPGYTDAALIDGASHTVIMFRIMFPLVKNMFAVVFLLAFVGRWVDYTTPMLFLPSYPTITYGLYLYQFGGENNLSSVPMQLAGCMISMIPTLVLFLCFKNQMMGNLTAGGLKE